MISLRHPAPFQRCHGSYFSCVDCYMSNAHHSFYSFFVLVPTQANYLSLGIALIFQIHFGIHPSNRGEKFFILDLFQPKTSTLLSFSVINS